MRSGYSLTETRPRVKNAGVPVPDPTEGAPPEPARAPIAPGSGPPPLNAAFLLIGLGRMLRHEVDADLRPLALSMRHLSALGHLSRQPGLSYSELARRAGITPQSMQATLRQLEQLQAVERRTVAGRGRTARLHVTPIGLDLLEQGQQVIRAAEELLMSDIPAEKQREFTTLLGTAFLAAVRRKAH